MYVPSSIENENPNNMHAHVTDVNNQNNEQKSLTVCFAPQFLSINPYQKQLADALNKQGVSVEGIDGMKVFLPMAFKFQKPDILHLHWLHTYFRAPDFNRFPTLKFLQFPFALFTLLKFFLGLIIIRLTGVRIIWTAHNLSSHETLFPILDYVCRLVVIHLSNEIIAHCHAAKCVISQRYHLKNTQKIHVIAHGHYINFYENQKNREDSRQILNIKDTSFVFLFLGLVRPYKGVGELIEAFNQLNSSNKRLVIAGKISNDNFSKEIAAKAEAEDQIQFVPGFVPDESIQTYMNASDVVVFPYRDVLTSGAVILAMSFGKPCIAPGLGCIGESLDTAGAFLYHPNEPDGLQNAMIQAFQAQSDLDKMGKYNQHLAYQWDWDLISQKTLAVYSRKII